MKALSRSVCRSVGWSGCEQNSGQARGDGGGDERRPSIAAVEEEAGIQIAQGDGDLCEIKGENGEQIDDGGWACRPGHFRMDSSHCALSGTAIIGVDRSTNYHCADGDGISDRSVGRSGSRQPPKPPPPSVLIMRPLFSRCTRSQRTILHLRSGLMRSEYVEFYALHFCVLSPKQMCRSGNLVKLR